MARHLTAPSSLVALAAVLLLAVTSSAQLTTSSEPATHVTVEAFSGASCADSTRLTQSTPVIAAWGVCTNLAVAGKFASFMVTGWTGWMSGSTVDFAYYTAADCAGTPAGNSTHPTGRCRYHDTGSFFSGTAPYVELNPTFALTATTASANLNAKLFTARDCTGATTVDASGPIGHCNPPENGQRASKSVCTADGTHNLYRFYDDNCMYVRSNSTYVGGQCYDLLFSSVQYTCLGGVGQIATAFALVATTMALMMF